MARDIRTLPKTDFVGGMAAGWAFGVPEAFKAALDIVPTDRVLSDNSVLAAELKERGVALSSALFAGAGPAVREFVRDLATIGLFVTDVVVTRERDRARLRVTLETEGAPPDYGFEPGDIFYEPPAARQMIWEQAQVVLRRSVQIVAIGKNKDLLIRLTTYRSGATPQAIELECSQAELATLLRTGVMLTALPQAGCLPDAA